jgi:hypothetical protein
MRMHMLIYENITVGPKGLMRRAFTWGDEFLGRAKTGLGWPKGRDNAILYLRWYKTSRWARMTWLAQRKSLGGPKQIACCRAQMSQLVRRKSLGGPKQVVRRWNIAQQTNPIVGKLLDPLTEWLNEFFGKTPCVEIQIEIMVKQIP